MPDQPSNGSISEKFFDYVSHIAHWVKMAFGCVTLPLPFGFTGVVVSNVLGITYAAWHEFYWDPGTKMRTQEVPM